jgi:hypothetical protein
MEIKSIDWLYMWNSSINGGNSSTTEEIHMGDPPGLLGDAYIQTQLGALSSGQFIGGADVWISFVWDVDGQHPFRTGPPTDRPHLWWARGCRYIEVTLQTHNAFAYGTGMVLLF